MDNFHFIDIKPAIDRKEMASIKDAIFKRAKEKAMNITAETNENYTAQIQNDVMEIARSHFEDSPSNPFNQFLENVGNSKIIDIKNNPKPNTEEQISKTDFSQNKELKHNIESVNSETYANSVKNETMALARKQFQSNLSASLNFLNTQAAINMTKKLNHR